MVPLVLGGSSGSPWFFWFFVVLLVLVVLRGSSGSRGSPWFFWFSLVLLVLLVLVVSSGSRGSPWFFWFSVVLVVLVVIVVLLVLGAGYPVALAARSPAIDTACDLSRSISRWLARKKFIPFRILKKGFPLFRSHSKTSYHNVLWSGSIFLLEVMAPPGSCC